MDPIHSLPRPQPSAVTPQQQPHPNATRQFPGRAQPQGALPSFPGNISAYEYEMMLPPHIQRRKRRGASRLVRVTLGVLIVVGLIVLFAMRLHTPDVKKATGQAEKFVVAMQSNLPDNAYAMGDAAFRQATTEQDLGAMFDRTEPFLTKSRIDLVDAYYATSEKGSPRAVVVFSATKGKQVTYIRLVMERQDKGDWKAHSLLTQSTPLQAKPE